MKGAGYATGFIGKWHLGDEAFYPEYQGFDVNIGGISYGWPPGGYFAPDRNPKIPDGPKGEYLTDRLTDEAIAFLRRNKDRPFFLYLSHYAVHNPMQSNEDHAVYAGMVESVDESVGRIMKELDRLDLAESTCLIFMSDNGGLSTAEGSPTSNLPLRAGKGWLYEGGIREPMIVRWRGSVKPGGTSAEPVISTDFYPTILHLAGLDLRPQQHVDGVSFAPLLRGAPRLDRDALYWHYPHYSNQGGRPSGAVRRGDYKLIEFYEDQRVELYNLADDLGEKRDLSGQLREKTAALRKALRQWRSAVSARMPGVNPDYRQARDPS